MKIFISWSGDRSKAVASALKTWLSDVFHDVDVWMSEHDISAGARWASELGRELENCSFGILCLTAENTAAPWLLYEAGSLAHKVKAARVVPYRFGAASLDVAGPLSHFQSVDADLHGTWKLLQSINENREVSLELSRLRRLFDRWWSDLAAELERIPPYSTPTPVRTERALIEEVLHTLRALDARIPLVSSGTPTWTPGQLLSSSQIVALTTSELLRYEAELDGLYREAEFGSEDENAILHVLLEVADEVTARQKETKGWNE